MLTQRPLTGAGDALNSTADGVVLSVAQVLEALEFVAPDRDQLECDLTFQHGTAHSGEGLYCWVAEYPEEGQCS